jgi:uncharacterized peroxidase-related enzyme
MPQLPSLPEPAHLSDLFRAFPNGVAPLMAYTDALLRDDGALSIANRELIAAYVSGLNACRFCLGSHAVYAELFGIAPGVIEALLEDPDKAGVPDRMRPLLAYVARLNTLPSRMTPGDAQAVFDAGHSEAALYEAIQICGLFNMMNRIVEGTGVDFDYGTRPEAHPAHGSTPQDHARSYAGFGERLAAASLKDT